MKGSRGSGKSGPSIPRTPGRNPLATGTTTKGGAPPKPAEPIKPLAPHKQNHFSGGKRGLSGVGNHRVW